MMMFKGIPARIRVKYMLIPACVMIITCIISEFVCGVPAFAYAIEITLAIVLSHALWILAFVTPIKFIDWIYQKLK